MTLHVRVLGEVEADLDGVRIELPRAKERAVLSSLALHDDRPVSVEQLIATVWDDDPPSTAVRTLRSHISRLRKAIGDQHVVTSDRGYKLVAGDGSIDARIFRDLIEQARTMPPTQARAALGRALGLWRGRPFQDLPDSASAQAEATWFEETRLTAALSLIDLRLDEGEHHGLIGELEMLTSEHPTKETVWARLVMALHRSGRRAEALQVFHRLRTTLAELTGLELGPDLISLERLVLADSPELDLPIPERATASSAVSIHQGQMRFVGRSEPLSRLDRLWRTACSSQSSVVVVTGDSGTGKTALLAEFATRVSSLGAVVAYGIADHDLRVPFLAVTDVVKALDEQERSEPKLSSESPSFLGRRLATTADNSAEGYGPTSELDHSMLLSDADELLDSISRQTPVLIVIDDVQWIDRASAAVVRRWARTTNRRVMIALSSRSSGVDHPGRDLIDDLTIKNSLQTIKLAGLTSDEISELLVHRPELDAADLAARTGGNPYLVHQLAEHGDPASLPIGVTALVGVRLRQVSATTREALEVAAVAGGVIDARVLSEVLDMTVDQIISHLDTAVTAGIIDEDPANLGQYLFDHDLTAETVRASASANRRALLHRRIAAAIATTISDPHDPAVFALADHLDAGMADPADRIEASLAAGQLATRSLAFDDAAEWLESALTLVESMTDPPPDTSARVLLETGRVRGLRQQPGARSLLLRAAELGDVSTLIKSALQLTRFNHARFAEGADGPVVKVIKLAIEACDDQHTHEWALLTSGLAAELMWVSSIDSRTSLANSALAVARQLEDPVLMGQVILRTQLSASTPDNLPRRIVDATSVIDSLETTDSAGSYEAVVAAMIALATSLFESSKVDEAKEMIHRARVLISNGSHTALSWRTTSLEVAIATITGRYSESELLLSRLSDETSGAESSKEMLLGRGWSQVFIDRGDHDVLEGIVSQFRKDTPNVPGWASAMAVMFCELGRTDEAAPLLDQVMSSPQFGDRNLGWLTHRCADAFVARAVENRGAMIALRDLLTPYSGRLCLDVIASIGPVDLALGILDSGLGDYDASLLRLEAAIADCQRIGAPAWEARCHLEQARCLAAMGRVADAHAGANRALDLAHSAGARLVASAAEQLLSAQDH